MRGCVAAGLVLLAGNAALAAQPEPAAGGATETVEQALCRLIETSARSRALPVGFLSRLIWRESSFRTGAVSRAGAQGVAQFMPGTAAERGLLDPFDPEQAIPAAASLLSDLKNRFGNLGLAAAAYNGGPGRVSSWLEGRGGLPAETQSYVVLVTGRTAEDWAEDFRAKRDPAPEGAAQSCTQVVALLRRPGREGAVAEAPFAPWGVQLAGNFSKELALASFARARASYARVIGEVRPMIIGTRLRTRGARTYYRIRVPATTRAVADALCERIRGIGGACVVLRS